MPWTYKAAPASDKYIATISKECIQTHDLEECKVIFTESAAGWETLVAFAVDTLAIGMSTAVRHAGIVAHTQDERAQIQRPPVWLGA